jgi:hypothetical protein
LRYIDRHIEPLGVGQQSHIFVVVVVVADPEPVVVVVERFEFVAAESVVDALPVLVVGAFVVVVVETVVAVAAVVVVVDYGNFVVP